MACPGHALADREADGLVLDEQARLPPAFAAARAGRAAGHDHVVDRRVEHPFRSGLVLNLLEGDHIGVQCADMIAQSGVVRLGTGTAALAVTLGEVLDIPARDLEAPPIAVRRHADASGQDDSRE